jgi:glutamyl-tRNA synthetase
MSSVDSDRRAASGDLCVVRLRSPEHLPSFDDIVCGKIGGLTAHQKRRANTGFYDDTILLKSDGLPTYHLANVIDDHLMEITHVLRGIEWLSSTGKHIALYEALNWRPPIFGHVSLLLKEDGNKLSKRSLDVNVESFRDGMGILPQALTNFVALMGWSHGSKSDVMTMDELIDAVSLMLPYCLPPMLMRSVFIAFHETQCQGNSGKAFVLAKKA